MRLARDLLGCCTQHTCTHMFYKFQLLYVNVITIGNSVFHKDEEFFKSSDKTYLNLHELFLLISFFCKKKLEESNYFLRIIIQNLLCSNKQSNETFSI